MDHGCWKALIQVSASRQSYTNPSASLTIALSVCFSLESLETRFEVTWSVLTW